MDYFTYDFPARDDEDLFARDDEDFLARDETEDDRRISMTLCQFCRRAKDLLSLSQTSFVRFVLTGEDTDGSQACIDPVFNHVTPNHQLHINRDYDSLLGFCSDILVDTNITVYPVLKLDDTLSRNIHISYEFTVANVSPLSYIQTKVIHMYFQGVFTEEVHKIPNICIGK